MLIVIVISEFLESHSKAKRTRAPAYSRELKPINWVVQRVVHGKPRSDLQEVRGDRIADTVSFNSESTHRIIETTYSFIELTTDQTL